MTKDVMQSLEKNVKDILNKYHYTNGKFVNDNLLEMKRLYGGLTKFDIKKGIPPHEVDPVILSIEDSTQRRKFVKGFLSAHDKNVDIAKMVLDKDFALYRRRRHWLKIASEADKKMDSLEKVFNKLNSLSSKREKIKLRLDKQDESTLAYLTKKHGKIRIRHRDLNDFVKMYKGEAILNILAKGIIKLAHKRDGEDAHKGMYRLLREAVLKDIGGKLGAGKKISRPRGARRGISNFFKRKFIKQVTWVFRRPAGKFFKVGTHVDFKSNTVDWLSKILAFQLRDSVPHKDEDDLKRKSLALLEKAYLDGEGAFIDLIYKIAEAESVSEFQVGIRF
jgi:hypothetical protein